MICSINGCDELTYARTWCNKHYQRWQRHGDPTYLGPIGRPAVDPVPRFWAKVQKTNTCWMWGSQLINGYGRFKINGMTIPAHRFAYELLVGPVPVGLQIDHQCHDPQLCDLGDVCPHRRCVNPAHLIPTTAAVNNSAARSNSFWRKKTHCPQGHPYNDTNTYRNPTTGDRHCRACSREYRLQHSYTKTNAA